ncbi:hypothetical protein [Marinomonas sp.]|uniref:hypothetical protein n=1 Tax=Marinomonas sp. TaxID=1904862 RepID=UPI003F9562C4
MHDRKTIMHHTKKNDQKLIQPYQQIIDYKQAYKTRQALIKTNKNRDLDNLIKKWQPI